jgi:2Fe-2S ferredoxin
MNAMTKITVLPHPEYAPSGTEIQADRGTSICDALLDHGVEIEHACGKVGACTTCHVIVRSGFASLNEVDDNEEDMLDRAWGLQPTSRLSCQAIVADEDLVVEIPRYSLNLAKEG